MREKVFVRVSITLVLFAGTVLPALADFQSGMHAYIHRNYPVAMREFKADGRAESNFNIGLMYYKGEGVKQDKKEAAVWILKSAKQGYGNAQFVYSAMNFTADGIDKNIQEGVKWMHKSADTGFAEAQFRLGMMYINGDNVAKDREKGIKLVKKAAKQGHVNAKKLLKVMGE